MRLYNNMSECSESDKYEKQKLSNTIHNMKQVRYVIVHMNKTNFESVYCLFCFISSTGDGSGIVHTGLAKRSIFDAKLAFRLEAPGVDWRKQIGSSSIGASFGLIMENLLDLQMCMFFRFVIYVHFVYSMNLI